MLARNRSRFSRDPSTQTGCAIIGPPSDAGVRGLGYNRFPPGVAETEERIADRPTRLALTVHAEIDALLDARRPVGATAYVWPWPPCAPCAGALTVARIRRVVAPAPSALQRERWGDSFALMEQIFSEAGVIFDQVEYAELARAGLWDAGVEL